MMKASRIALLLLVVPTLSRGDSTCSGPIAITPNDGFVWAVNRDNNTVTVINVTGDLNQKVAEIVTGGEPRCVAIAPNGQKVYVTNMVGGTVAVINAVTGQLFRVIPVGTEPFGCAVTPNGAKLYVSNFSSDTVSVINTATDTVIKTIALSSANAKPRGIAITPDGAKVYVTSFLAQLRAGGVEGADDGKEGHVTVIATATDSVVGTVVLNPLANTGFNANGDALARIPIGPNPIFPTGAFPNLLESLCTKGNRVYVPSTGSSPNGPVLFNVNTQSLISAIDIAADVDSGQTINMNFNVGFEPAGVRLFNTNPRALRFKNSSGEGYAVLGATNRLIRVVLDGAGTPSVNPPSGMGQPSGIVRIPVGTNPTGLVINSIDTRAYVLNFLSRDVSVVDIADGSPSKHMELARIPSAALPVPGSLASVVLRGHELFNTAIGPVGTVLESQPPAGRMSNFGWGACYNCHPDGLHDGVTWIFGDGPRQTISMENTAEHPQPPGSMFNANGAPLLPAFKQRLLNWSATRDEVPDFERNIRVVSGGEGLILGVPITDVPDLTPVANTGRSSDLDAIAAYISFGIRAPISPLRPRNVGPGGPLSDPDIIAGRALFTSANCQQCHGGPNWTRSRVFYTPPPDPALVVNGQVISALRQVGTFDPAAINEVRQNASPPLGADGFNVPSLISIFAGTPYFHNGAAPTLDDVLANVTHRSSGTGGVDTLTSAADRARVVKFLKSIDAKTPTFP